MKSGRGSGMFGPMAGPKRVFLGWEGPLLHRAAEWLLSEHPDGASEVMVALPGARAGRALTEYLARIAPATWDPPRILTAGRLPDELVELPRPAASRLVRTHAWAEALSSLSDRMLARLFAEAPGRQETLSWVELAGDVRALFGELAGEGRSFADVLSGPLTMASAGERGRWQALCEAQAAMQERLEALGLCDPHLARCAALDAGEILAGGPVVVVGVADPVGLVRRALECLGGRATVLIGAPEELAAGFDACGAIDTEFWAIRESPLRLEDWTVAREPADQARRCMEVISGFDGAHPAEEISIGLLDPDVAPYLRRQLAGHGVTARDAAGTPLSSSGAYRLLEALSHFLRGRSFEDLSALVRHPDLTPLLVDGGAPDPGDDLDRYHQQHFPARDDGYWRGGIDRDDDERATRLRALYERLMEALGELGHPGHRLLGGWVEAVRGWLELVYGGRDLDPASSEEDRRLVAVLRAVSSVLEEILELPDALVPEVTCHEALALILGELGSRQVPPASAREGEPTIELLGWLELALDDAPALVVTGLNEGRVPAPLSHPAWLPGSCRAELSLVDARSRLARDLYLLEWMLNSRGRVHVISGRETLDGDPLAQSRLALQVGADRILERIRHSLGAGSAPQPAVEGSGVGSFVPHVRPEAELVGPLAVTAFRDYLASPYLFYLKRVERCRTLHDHDEELDGGAFGNLAHHVLESFGRSELANVGDAEAIAEYLDRELRAQAERQFGDVAHPAVSLQIMQLSWRLGQFAKAQAEEFASGWRIHEVEWSTPREGIALDVDGEPFFIRGTIDRIDRNESGEWRILDYKTGDKAADPSKTHFSKRSGWKDLQLPLYAHLAAGLTEGKVPQLGFFALGRSEEESGVRPCKWGPVDVDSALECARDVVRAIRRREWSELGSAKTWDPIFGALCGEGLLGGVRIEVKGADDDD